MKAYNSEVQESLSLIFNASRILFFEKTTIGLLTQYVKKQVNHSEFFSN